MDMLTIKQIDDAGLTDWRKLGRGLHARYLVRDFGTGAVRRRTSQAVVKTTKQVVATSSWNDAC